MGGDKRQGGSWLLGPTGSCLLTEPILETGITKAPSCKGCVRSCRVMACGPILAQNPISFGLENVLQIFKNEVIAHKNPDFWLCWRNPKGLATPGPHILMTTSGGPSSSCPLLVFGLETPDLIHAPPCTDGEIEPQRGEGTCHRPHSRWGPWSWAGCLAFRPPLPSIQPPTPCFH